MSEEPTPPPSGIRLKPRLTPPQPEGSAVPNPEPAMANPPPPPPESAPPSPPPDSPKEKPSFKLKPKSPAPAEAAPAPVASPSAGIPPPDQAPPPPTSAPSAPAAPPATQTPQPPAPDTAATATAPATPGKSRRGPLIGVAALVVVAALGFFGWKYFLSPPPASPAPVAAKASSTPPAKPATTAAESTAAAALTKIAQAPGKAIQLGQEAISSRRTTEQSRIDAAAAGEDTPERPAAANAATASAAKTGTAKAADTVAVEAEAQASPAFRAFVKNARISGVFQGSPARAVINGRLARAGDRVDAELEIVFEGVAPDRRQLIFSDRTGAKVYRPY